MILCWAVLAVSGVAAAVWLAGGALASWRQQRAGLVYELTPRYLGTVLRGGAALTAFGCALTGSVGVAVTLTPRPRPSVTAAAAGLPLSADARPSAGPLGAAGAAPAGAAAGSAGRAAAAAAVPAATPGSAAPGAAVGMVTVGHPHGGELLQGTLPGVPGMLRVWLPKQYPGHAAPLQALLVLTDDSELDDVLEGLSEAVDLGRADPFVAVLPAAVCAPTGTVAPAPADDELRRAVAARFHLDPDPDGWGVLGLDAGAPCAVAAELAHPSSYRATAALGGRYDSLPAPASAAGPAASAAPLRLLLAASRRDTAGQASASKLNAALVRLPHTDVRLNSAVRDFSVQRERFRLVRLAAAYLTEQFAMSRR